MLAKRLSIAVLLSKGYTYPQVAGILKVTPSTIANVSLSLKYGSDGYKKAVEKILINEKIESFFKNISKFLNKKIPSKGFVPKKHQLE